MTKNSKIIYIIFFCTLTLFFITYLFYTYSQIANRLANQEKQIIELKGELTIAKEKIYETERNYQICNNDWVGITSEQTSTNITPELIGFDSDLFLFNRPTYKFTYNYKDHHSQHITFNMPVSEIFNTNSDILISFSEQIFNDDYLFTALRTGPQTDNYQAGIKKDISLKDYKYKFTTKNNIKIYSHLNSRGVYNLWFKSNIDNTFRLVSIDFQVGGRYKNDDDFQEADMYIRQVLESIILK